ncbi:MAG: metal ABC transporter permease [Vulcanimicrobiaceae bacterium]
MLDTLLSPFHLDFMVRGFIAALIVGVLCSTMGTFVILRKLSFIGDGIAHASFAGIVIAYMKGANYYAGAAIVAVITALGIGFVHRKGNISLDTTIGVLFTGAFALGIFLMSRLHTYTVDLQDFLFGNILGVSHQDLIFIAVLAAIVIITLAASYRALIYTSFDPVVAKSSGIPADFIDYLLLVMLALTIVVTLEAVGIVLVAALLVTPAAAAYQLTNRLSRMMLLSAILGAVCSVGGLYLSYYLNAASGATIVLMATLVFFIAIGVRRVRTALAASEAQA